MGYDAVPNETYVVWDGSGVVPVLGLWWIFRFYYIWEDKNLDHMSKEAERRIKKALDENASFLDLSACDLEVLPHSLGGLTELTGLKINDNRKLNDISILSQLSNLVELFAYNTLIKDLSPLRSLNGLKNISIYNTKVGNLTDLSELYNLNQLHVNHTIISDLNPLARLNKLMVLSVHNTKVTDLTPLMNLDRLTVLFAHNTNVSSLAPLSKLNNLTRLSISNTLVTNLSPIKLIIAKGVQIKNEEYSYESGIYIQGCQLNNPPLEIIKQGNKAILLYWEQINQQDGIVELYEAKLIIVGEGATGKTTLFEKLKNPSHQVGTTTETHGINIYEGLPFQHEAIGENIFHINLWDFGGQDLQYMTHQFFLTPRALYVLMMDARRESPNLAYWFKIISLLGRETDDSKEKVKLILVFNKRANSTGLPQYQDILKFYEDTIDSYFLEVDFAINDYRFESLQKSIQEHLIRLPIVKSQLPRLWKSVREDLRAETKQENYISTRRFSDICRKYDIEKEEDQWLLSSYMHQLGSLLHFQNDRGLRSWVILNPQWAVDGVYSFLMNENIRANYGHFQESDFIQLLRIKGYSHEGADLILQLMTKNNFDICYEASPRRYVAAQLLPDVAPEYAWYTRGRVLQFRYQYSMMPKGLMSRLIVRLSDHLDVHPVTGKHIVWKKGGIFRLELKEGTCRVRLREDDAESKSGLRQILIDVIGEEPALKYALHKIRDEVDDLHRRWFRSLRPDEMVPCCCSECKISNDPQLYKLENLLKKSSKRIDTSCDFSGKDILIQTLLEGIYDQQEIYKMKRER